MTELEHADEAHHIVPVSVYVTIFVALMLLTATTTAVAFVDLGIMNNVIMLTIAVLKATLVILFFMHVRYSGRMIWLFAGSGFLWLALMIGVTLADVVTRGWLG